MKPIYTALILFLPAFSAFAGTSAMTSVPALDDGGLLVLSTFVGLAASWAIKRRKK